MALAHHRHDISDKTWALLEPHLPGRVGSWGGIAKDNRTFINAVFWVLRTRRSVARFAARLWPLEQCASPFYPLEKRRNLGKIVGSAGGFSRL